MKAPRILCAAIIVLSAACSGPDVEGYRRALADAELSLTDAVDVGMAQTHASSAVKAALLIDGDAVYRVDGIAERVRRDVRIDTVSGEVLSVHGMGAASDSCPGAITLADAIAIGEDVVEGEGVAIAPDDDVECAWEVQVLGDTLYEVKVASDGEVLEHEVAD